jgi:uncharacterized repeat protein (TIGR01451 family)
MSVPVGVGTVETTEAKGANVSYGLGCGLLAVAVRAALVPLCTGLTLLGASPVAGATPTRPTATAPFPCQTAKVYLAQGNTPPGSVLYQAVTGPGSLTFSPVGMTAGGTYNAIGLNPTENLIYGVVTAAGGSLSLGHLVQVDANGVAVDRGPLSGESTPLDAAHTDAGAFDGIGHYYVYASGGDKVLHVIDTNTNPVAQISERPLTGTLPADVTFVGPVLWGSVGDNLVRIDPATGVVTTFPKVLTEPVTAAAAWTYGNGNLGLQDTASGVLYQVHITDPAGEKPRFTLIADQTGPLPQGQTDGTSCIGQPVDLGVTASSEVTAGTITWTVTVHNFSPADSSGFTLTDVIPAKVTDLDTDAPGCQITGQTVRCVAGTLMAAHDATFTFRGATPVDGTPVTTTATVIGNESDRVKGNNTATTTTQRQGADLSLLQSSTPDHVVAGNPVTWSLRVHNGGPGNSRGFTVTDPLPDNVSHLATTTPGCGFTEHTLTCAEGPLGVGEKFVITFTGNAPNSGRIDNTAIVTGRDPDPNHANDSATARTHIQGRQRHGDGEVPRAEDYIPKQPGEYAGHDRRARNCSRHAGHGSCQTPADQAGPPGKPGAPGQAGAPERAGKPGLPDATGLDGLFPSTTPPGSRRAPA